MMFRCPVCHDKHSVQNNYDNQDFICLNGDSSLGQRTFNNLTPEDLMSRNEPLKNRFSTKVDEARAVTVFPVPEFRRTGEKLGTNKPNY
ncbi:hypothetical protein CMI37_31080 [Candidatus Pacearchaeota archaeon]|nr:hypothetical protein [Candidatus Pacearchaeota archaeon]|tara:strand:+ start:3785 stop:4051 length:267 start_codon:yes stop_codon:yes gene_type:complete